jgi:hypothetical protein
MRDATNTAEMSRRGVLLIAGGAMGSSLLGGFLLGVASDSAPPPAVPVSYDPAPLNVP